MAAARNPQIGEVVYLKSGSPAMTVIGVDTHGSTTVRWFPESLGSVASAQGSIQESFPKDCLTQEYPTECQRSLVERRMLAQSGAPSINLQGPVGSQAPSEIEPKVLLGSSLSKLSHQDSPPTHDRRQSNAGQVGGELPTSSTEFLESQAQKAPPGPIEDQRSGAQPIDYFVEPKALSTEHAQKPLAPTKRK